jgi:hypothetical protein
MSPSKLPVRKIVSGGQTGVDRAALDVAIELGLDHGGWCPRGRKAEDGPIDLRYQLRETRSTRYEVRTRRNVRDSGATLILARGEPSGGTAFTLLCAQRQVKHYRLVDLQFDFASPVRRWLMASGVTVLNVAGPRESTAPGIYQEARVFLLAVLSPSELA